MLSKTKAHYRCTLCNVGYSSKTGLRRHNESKHPERDTTPKARQNYNCHICDLSFYHRSSLNRHLNEQHEISTKIDNSVSMDALPTPISESSTEHKNATLQLPDFPKKYVLNDMNGNAECNFCSMKFSCTNPSLIYHKLTQHGIAPSAFDHILSPPGFITCPHCSTSLDTGKSNFPEHVCAVELNEPMNLNKATSPHNEVDILGKSTTVNQLKTNPSPLLCPLCSDSFVAVEILREHVNIFHRTDYTLFGDNGPYRQASLKRILVMDAKNYTSLPSSSSSPENLLPQTISSSSKNCVPDRNTFSTNAINATLSINQHTTVNQPAMVGNKCRRPMGVPRASAADKWRNIDGFNCGTCNATFLTSQSRAQHLRWKHPEVFISGSVGNQNSGKEKVQLGQPNLDRKTDPLHALEPHKDSVNLEGTLKSIKEKDVKEKDAYNCPYCSSSYISARSRAQHVRWSHPEQSNELNVIEISRIPSSELAQSEEELIQNLLTGYKGYCEVCGYTLANAQGRAQHLRHKHPEAWALLKNCLDSNESRCEDASSTISIEGPLEAGGSFECQFCDKAFSSKKGRGRHYYWSHRSCLGEITKDDLDQDSQKNDTNRKTCSCPRCPRKFNRRVGLSIHMAQSHHRHRHRQGSDVPKLESIEEINSNAEIEKTTKASAQACCLLCESCFACQAEVVSHCIQVHNITEPNDDHWVWTIVHSDDDIEQTNQDSDEHVDIDTVPYAFQVRKQHLPPNLECTECLKTLPNELLFRGHMLLDHQIKYEDPYSVSQPESSDLRIRCDDCHKVFSSLRALHIHEHHTKHGPHRISGPVNTVSTTHQDISKSTNECKVHSEQTCISCSRVFNSLRALRIHQKMSERCRNAMRVMQENEKTVVPMTQETQSSTEQFPCDMCTEVFTRPQGLACHKRSRHNYVSMSPRCVATRQKNILKHTVTMPVIVNNDFERKFPKCRYCKLSFKKHYQVIEHVNLKSQCALMRRQRYYSYRNAVWTAIRRLSTLSSAKPNHFKLCKTQKPIVKLAYHHGLEKTLRPQKCILSMGLQFLTKRHAAYLFYKVKPELEYKPQILAPASSSHHKCALCSKPFPSNVQLMIHLCRGCSGKSRSLPALLAKQQLFVSIFFSL